MQGTGERWRLGRRPALDGVRGIAILLVLVAHMDAPAMSGLGAMGVTVFFALSGFLITALLLEEHERAGRLDLRRFYERRARRLLPVLLVVTAVVAVLAPTLGSVLMPWQAVPAVVFYYANWLGDAQLGGALGGTWSLAVEEQFYLLWPMLVGVLVRRGPRTVLRGALLGVTTSVAVRLGLILSGADVGRIYHGSDSVAFALLAGAALAAWQVQRPTMKSRRAWLAVALPLLAAPMLWSKDAAQVFGPLLAAPAGILLVTTAASSHAPQLLQGRALTWLGQRSYGIYLWHVPIGFVLRQCVGWSWWAIGAVMLPLALLLAEASYRTVEVPFRRRQSSNVSQATCVNEPSRSFTHSGCEASGPTLLVSSQS